MDVSTRFRSRPCSSAVVLLGLAVGGIGCAGERDSRLGMLKGADPLMGEKIPSPNVPTGRDTYGLKDNRDPLIRAAAGRTNPDTPATLAAGRRDAEQSDLRIPDDRRPAGAVASRDGGGEGSADQIVDAVKRRGGRVFSPRRTDAGAYEVRVQIPSGDSGAMTGFIGVGNTPTAALKDAYTQARTERK